MRAQTGKTLESHRITEGPMASRRDDGFNGAFILPGGLRIICSDGFAWEHVSVSREDRCPTWEEMCFVKDLFWDEHEWVVQYHPPKASHINCHPFCLHLWRPTNSYLPTPPPWMVGPKDHVREAAQMMEDG